MIDKPCSIREKAALYETTAAACEAHFGNGAAAKRRALAALKIGKGRDVEYAAAFAVKRLHSIFVHGIDYLPIKVSPE